ncbi:hypothetical protein ERD78_05190 [Allopusillimonas soli]|uniref:Uncharacterized protein n=1 Tax=Allopusillimonas soli TaxID=659016 RepID=A0A853F8X8_9BURK|nr:hypothetical protein [Allopusillimonas soli]NYT36258.1 hypothetical protein [Allopusillimonas soli]TEA76583.1 hypothetical protein ERD78_05190 [Allopusillimonas soli]
MRHQKWLGIAVLLMGCSATLHSQITHEIQVRRHVNDFLQTREIAVWSIRSRSDTQNNLWPSGLTLNARVTQHHDGTQQRFLMLRKDEISTEENPTAIYNQVRRRQAQLRRQCSTMTLVQDGHNLELPVHGITVRALTNADRMPTAPTDYTSDPVESMVSKNTSDAFIISTMVQARIDPNVWRGLASAQTLDYELCGEMASATSAERKGFQELIAREDLLRGDASRGVR